MKRNQSDLDDEISQFPLDAQRPSLSLKPPILLECRVCGASAHGFNFDQISCDSCKTFFRRNALRPMSELSCRFSGSCSINVDSRRTCTYCRLKKCFEVKMKKEWIRTDEERQLREMKRLRKQQKTDKELKPIQIVERKKNRLRLDCPPVDPQRNALFSPKCLLTDNDHSLINNINHSYQQWALQCNIEHVKYYSFERVSFVHFLNDEQAVFRSLIDFFKQIPEFRSTPVEDQILLIKCNLTHLVHVHNMLRDQFTENTHIGRLMSRWISPSFNGRLSRTRRHYSYFIEHPIILKLSLVVMIFTINLSRLSEKELHRQFVNKKALVEAQMLYVTLLWNYLNVVFDARGAVQSMGLLVFQHLRYQKLMSESSVFIEEHFHPSQFHPLTKSVLCLS